VALSLNVLRMFLFLGSFMFDVTHFLNYVLIPKIYMNESGILYTTNISSNGLHH